MRRLAVTGQAIGVLVSGAEDVLVEELWIHDNARRGLGAQDFLGLTSLSVRGSLLEHNREFGVHISGADAALEATVVRDTSLDAQGIYGRGINVQRSVATDAPGTVVVKSSLVERNREVGVFALGSDASVEATVVRDTLPDALGNDGRGIGVKARFDTGARANLVVKSSLLERNHWFGISVEGSDAAVEATVVRDTFPDAQGGGPGIGSSDNPVTGAPGSVFVSSSLLERNHWFGLFIQSSDVTVDATVVRDTLPDEAQGFFGRAVQIQRNTETGTAACAASREPVRAQH